MVFRKVVVEHLHVCPECGFHYRIDARTRIEQLVDTGTFEECQQDMVSTDPLRFADRIPYKERLKKVRHASGEIEAIVTGRAFIRGRKVILGVMNSNFIMASMGAVVGEKVTSAVETATDEDLPLAQMAKTSAALGRFDEAGGLYIGVLTDPTTAGVAASFAMLGDVIIAEPRAMVGFAGPRVIANTIKAELPEGFQTAEFMLEHGFVDRIVERKNLRSEIARIIDYCGK